MSERAGVDVLVVGPGAMGCLHAAWLAESGLRVGLLDHRPERAAAIQRQGVMVEREGATALTPVRCSANAADFSPARLVVILVKAYDTQAATAGALGALTPESSVLSLQNGLGNYEQIARRVAPAQVLAGTTSSGATLLGVAKVREAGRGMTRLGSPFGERERARSAARMLSDAGLPCEVADSVGRILWEKAIVNAAINPLTALTGLRNGQLLEVPALRDALAAIATEAARVAAAAGIEVGDDMGAVVEQVCRQTAANRSSMLQDLSAGRRTETDHISGEIARRAAELGVGAPLCGVLNALVKAAESKETMNG